MNSDVLMQVLRRRGDIRYRTLDGEAVVVRQRAGEVLVLNEVAARLLDLADGATPLGAWVDTLLGEYEVDREVLERDVAECARELTEAGLLEPTGLGERGGAGERA
jgi:Coenzyme PQQ synthesis protein D (PqqD)